MDSEGLRPGDIAAFVAAFAALFVGYYTIRLQIISSIQKQLYLKAVDCNKYIVDFDQSVPKGDVAKLSAIITSILFARVLVRNQLPWFRSFFWSINRQTNFIDYFYLQLHTSIICLVKDDLGTLNDWDNEIREQHRKAGIFLSISIAKFSNI
jgi:hypothetical protein